MGARWSRWSSWWVFAALACAILTGGCGGSPADDEVVITESPTPDFAPSPGEQIITAPRSSRPALPSASAPASSGSLPSNAPTGSPTAADAVPFLMVLPSLTTESGEFVPRVRVELTATVGGKPVSIVDETSGDGLGMAGRFKSVRPGRYLMRVVSPALPDHPLADRPVIVDGHQPESLSFGAATIRIPKKRSFEVAQAIEIAIVEEPSKKPVFKAVLSSCQARGVLGDVHPLTLLLAFGQYSYTLVDLSKDPTIGFFNLPKGTRLVLEENTFALSADKPVAIVSLENVIRAR